ncbi:MAG: hypothetical protein Q4F40_10435, partial [Akkermansia sp.]|nr:hypothetical protein [Akkermansia sp.]
NHRRTSSSFFKNFVFFCNIFSKTLKNQRFQKSHFWHFFNKRQILPKKSERKAPLLRKNTAKARK